MLFSEWADVPFWGLRDLRQVVELSIDVRPDIT